ncbi:hypothetical protein [Sulfurovum sp.]|uniref:hypothetical protein n=1 Tax=Sulfurovum sp. TaxID=1969726 RepID=UPI0028680C94|nr:hypothetical protein [Sulfurovum sp.]
MNTTDKNEFTLQNIKEKGTSLLESAGGFLSNAISIFKKDESTMTIEEKVEKQHLLNFIYGMGAGIVIYHFMIGALLILGIIWFYNFSLKKTKTLISEQEVVNKPVKKRTYKKRQPTAKKAED